MSEQNPEAGVSDAIEEIEDKKIERDGSAPVQQSQADVDLVHLPGLLSDEFGISRSVARRDIIMGEVTLDGEPVELQDRVDLDRESAVGKTLTVKGGDSNRTYSVQIQ